MSRPEHTLSSVRRSLTAILWGSAFLLASACGRELAGTADKRPSVVVYCIDTLRADHLGCYGYGRGTSPFLDELAAESILFENAIAQAPWTIPSVASLVTSTYPSSHGILVGGRRLPAKTRTMAEVFAEAGYRTAGFVHNVHAGSAIGADQGYRDYLESIPPGGPSTKQERKHSRSISPVIEWTRHRQAEQPFFLYVHTTEPHWPYHKLGPFGSVSVGEKKQILEWLDEFRKLTGHKPDEDEAHRISRIATLRAVQTRLAEHRQAIVDLYDNEVRQADRHLQRVVQALRDRKLWDNTLFVLVADHGQEMDEHGYWQHDQSLFQELIHVPLLIKLPGHHDSGRRIREPVQVIDILPTLAQIAGLTRSPSWEGRSLKPLIEGRGNPPDAAFSERINIYKDDPAISEERGNIETAVIRAGFKAIWHREPDRVSLFDLAADAGEQQPLDGAMPQRVKQVRHLFEAWLERPRPEMAFERRHLTRRQIEGLRELGYLR